MPPLPRLVRQTIPEERNRDRFKLNSNLGKVLLGSQKSLLRYEKYCDKYRLMTNYSGAKYVDQRVFFSGLLNDNFSFDDTRL
jgi:hypothetical protein